MNEYVEIIVSEFETNVMSLQQYPKRGRIAFELEWQGISQYGELIQGYDRIVYEIADDTVIVHSIRLDDDVIDYFKQMAAESGIDSVRELFTELDKEITAELWWNR